MQKNDKGKGAKAGEGSLIEAKKNYHGRRGKHQPTKSY